MHVTTKDTDEGGAHILTSTLEADGASELASDKAKLEAKVISVSRTASGGITVQTAVSVTEPVPEVVAPAPPPPPEPTREEQAIAYFVSKGKSAEDAADLLAKFGAERVLAMRDSELDQQLAGVFKK